MGLWAPQRQRILLRFQQYIFTLVTKCTIKTFKNMFFKIILILF
jgi:hypothetical protein